MIPRRPAAVSLLALSLLARCAADDRDATPGVLLVTTEAFRADLTALEGGGIPVPVLEALAEEGSWSRKVYTPTPLTGPAAASVQTGMPPWEHGVRSDEHPALPGGLPVMAEAFRAAGWRTAAFVGSSALGETSGLGRGFEIYSRIDPEERKVSRVGGSTFTRLSVDPARELPAGGIVLEAGAFLANLPPDEPFFVWVHFVDPAAPHEAPPEWAERFPGDPHAAEMAVVDDAIGRILDALDLRGRRGATTVVFAPLTGEARGEGGETTHGLFLADRTVRTGLLLRPGRGAAPELPSEPFSLTALPGLVLGAAGIPWSGPAPAGGPVVSETLAPWELFRRAALQAVRGIDGPACSGPAGGPLRPLDPGVADEACLPLEEARPALDDFRGPPPESLLPQLERLGKIASDLGGEDADAKLADALREYEALATDLGAVPAVELGAASVLARSGHREEALDRVRRLVASEGAGGATLVSAADFLASLGEEGETEGVLRRALAGEPGELGLSIRLARLYRRQGRSEDALAVVEAAESAAGRVAAGVVGLRGDLLVEMGDTEGALAAFREASRLAPHNALWALREGEQLMRLGDLPGARQALRRGERVFPRPAEIYARLGQVALAEGKKRRGLALFRRSLSAPPGTLAVETELADTLARAGHPDLALETLAAIPRERFDEATDPGASFRQYLFDAARYAILAERLDDADGAITRLREADPANPSVALLEGILRCRQGREGETARALGEAMRLSKGAIREQALADPCIAALPADAPARQVLEAPSVRKPRRP